MAVLLLLLAAAFAPAVAVGASGPEPGPADGVVVVLLTVPLDELETCGLAADWWVMSVCRGKVTE